MLEQFDGNCVQDGAKLYEEGVIFYSVFPLYVLPLVVIDIKMTEKVLCLYLYSPKKSLLPKNVHAKFIQIPLCQSKLCTMKSAPDGHKKCVY